MKLILHHLLKDIRAQRWLLLLWALGLFVIIVANALIFLPDYDLAKRIETLRTSPLLGLICIMAWIVLVARLIQSESVVGSTSFWLTRPVPPHVYLLSKLLFLLFLVILPSFLPSLVVAIQFQSSPETLKDNLEGLFFLQLFGGLFVIWLATYTPSLLHFAGALCVGLLGIVLLSFLAYSLRGSSDLVTMPTAYFFGFNSGTLVFGLLASLVLQHWTRKTRIGLTLGIGAILITFAAPISVPQSSAPMRPNRLAERKSVQIEFSPDWQKSLVWSQGDIPRAMATLSPVVDDKNAEPVIQSVLADFQVSGERPVGLPSDNSFYIPWILPHLNSSNLLREKLSDFSMDWANQDWPYNPPIRLFALVPRLRTLLEGKTGVLTLHLQGQMMSLQQQARTPLNQPSFIARIPGGFIRVRPVANKELVVWKIAPERSDPLNSQDTMYVLVDPQNHTATDLNQGGSSTEFTEFANGAPHLLVDSEVSLNLKGNEPLERMVLYVFEITPGGSFKSTLTAPDFTMNPK